MRSHVDELIAFARDNPWKPKWPEGLMRRFLTELVSVPEMVIELSQDGRRVALAALVDKLKNPANHACLEVLGVSPEIEPFDAISAVVAQAINRLPAERSGFQLGFHESVVPPVEWLQAQRLKPGYATYEMWRGKNAGRAEAATLAGIELLEGMPRDRELYDVLVESFSRNPDTSIPPFERWSGSREGSLIWVWREGGSIKGFANVSLNAHEGWAEISTLGVLPQWRGRGVGRELLLSALSELEARGVARCRLSVAVKNKRALGLYQGLGFQVTDHYQIFCYERARARA